MPPLRRFLILIAAIACFTASLYYVRQPTGPRDADGVSGPTIIQPDPAQGEASEPILAYSGRSPRRGDVQLGKALSSSAASTTKAILLPGSGGPFDAAGIQSAQYVPPDRLYYVGRDRDGRGSVCLARRSQSAWKASERPVLDAGVLPTWAERGTKWISIVPAGVPGTEWRLWFVAKSNGVGRIGYATSRDGLRWTPKTEPVLVLADGASVETISVQIWAGGFYGWSVIWQKDRPAGELVGFTVGADGIPSPDREPVAWQAPELRFGNLPKDAIPIVDARAEPDPSDARHVRLYVTYRDNLGKTAITSADNFPVAGEWSPTIFARQVKPLVAQGSDLSAPRRSALLIAGLTSAWLVLLVLGILPSSARGKNVVVAEEDGVFEQAEEEPELRNGAGKSV